MSNIFLVLLQNSLQMFHVMKTFLVLLICKFHVPDMMGCCLGASN